MIYIRKILSVTMLITAAFFCSCGDDTVTSQNPPINGIDTVAMYEWSWDTISGYLLSNIYIADSNNIFFEGSGGSMMYYDGKNYTPISYNDPTFSSISIDGFSEDNVFISGVHYVSPGPAKPSLKIWNGSGFQGFEFPNDTGQSMLNITVVGYNMAWMHNGFHNVYYFNNGSFTRYSVDSLLGGCVFYISPNNEVYLFSTGRGYLSYSINIGYKFTGNAFDVIYIDSVSTYSNLTGTYFLSKPYILGGGYRAINIFNNNDWSWLCNTYNFYPNLVCAATPISIFCYGEGSEGGYGTKPIFFWNGIKWILEKNFYYLLYGQVSQFPVATSSSQMFIIDNKIYLNFNNYSQNTSYFLKGKPIKKGELK